MKSILLICLLSVSVFSQEPALKKDDGDKELKKLIVAAWKVSSRISPDPQKLRYVFDKPFFNYLSEDKMTAVFKELYNSNGSVINVSSVTYKGGLSADFFFYTDKKQIIPVSITLNGANWKVAGLFFRPSFKELDSIESVTSKFEKLPYAHKTLLVKRLSGIEDNIYARDEKKAMAVGSSFKLYILAALIKNELPWDKVIKTKAESRSLPSGRLHLMPEATPFTVFSLAMSMISSSDNTATDMLIDYAGKDKIEAVMSVYGNAFTDMNKPFLKTLEMFKIKSSLDIADRYAAASLKERKKILKETEKIKLNEATYRLDKPTQIRTIEWFASMDDMCVLLNDFRKMNNKNALTVLSMNPGMDMGAYGFNFVGYKGGSEPGVLSTNWLIETKSKTWYCVSAAVNDETMLIDEKAYLLLMRDILFNVSNETF